MKQFHLLTPHQRHMTKLIVRGHKEGLVDQCFGDEEIGFYIRNKTEHVIRGEVKKMRSQEFSSTTFHEGPSNLLMEELTLHIPTLLSVLSASVGKQTENRSAIIGRARSSTGRNSIFIITK